MIMWRSSLIALAWRNYQVDKTWRTHINNISKVYSPSDNAHLLVTLSLSLSLFDRSFFTRFADTQIWLIGVHARPGPLEADNLVVVVQKKKRYKTRAHLALFFMLFFYCASSHSPPCLITTNQHQKPTTLNDAIPIFIIYPPRVHLNHALSTHYPSPGYHPPLNLPHRSSFLGGLRQDPPLRKMCRLSYKLPHPR